MNFKTDFIILKYVLSIFFFSFIVSLSSKIFAQNINPALIKRELEKRNINENELRDKLLEKGVDPNQINPSNIGDVQETIKSAVNELENKNTPSAPPSKTTETNEEAEKNINSTIKRQQVAGAKENADKVQKAVKDGASVREALAEELLDIRDSLPPTQIFGQHIFRNKNIKLFRQADDIKPSENYVLGSGDKVTVNIWGSAKYSASQEISKDGYVQFDKLPRFYLKGLTLGKARELLKSRFRQYVPFSNDQFDVTISYARTVSINIVGEVFNPGSYTLPAFNSAYNALVAAGGPTDIGSVRNIQLIRPGQKPQRLDVYEFLLNPTTAKEWSISENDYINVPVSEKLVTIQGAVNRPFIYELTQGEQLKKLLQYAGGLKDKAFKSTIQIKRYVGNKEVILDANLAELEAGKDIELVNGDVVSIKTIEKKYENFVEISGAVEYPGNYELSTPLKIKDILDKAVLLKEARKDIAFLFRQNLDSSFRMERFSIEQLLSDANSTSNFILLPKDKIVIYKQARFSDTYSVVVKGEVRQPGTHLFDKSGNMTVADLTTLGGGLKPSATDYGYIIRTNKENGKVRDNIRVNLKGALDGDSNANVRIEAGDTLIILSKEDFSDIFYIKIEGAVRNPGEYAFKNKLSLKDAIAQAGGMRTEAAINRVDVFRLEMNKDKVTRTTVATFEVDPEFKTIQNDNSITLEPFDIVVVRYNPEFELQKTVTLEGEVRYPGVYSLLTDNEKISSIIARAGGVTPEAFPEGAILFRTQDNIGSIITKLDQALQNENSPFNYLMKDGDKIFIPKSKDLVSIQGATKAVEVYTAALLNQGRINVAYQGEYSAKWYINKYAAGLAENANRKNIIVEYPSGEIKRTKNYGLFKIYPKVKKGSLVTVGYEKKKLEKDKTKKEDVDWGKVLANAITQATAVLSLILLIQNINK